jgi:hypothetical protein
MNRPLKFLTLICLLVFLSWLSAAYWSQSGQWWVTHRPDWKVSMIHFVVRPALSSDVAVAEDQLDFLTFWVPTFLVMFILLVGGYLYKWNRRTSNA